MADCLDFEDVFQTEEEKTLDIMKLLLDAEESHDQIVNPKEVEKVLFVYRMIKRLAKGKDVSVKCELHKPCKSKGYISIEGDLLECELPEDLATAISFAFDFEIYMKTSGKVEMIIGFDDLTTIIE